MSDVAAPGALGVCHQVSVILSCAYKSNLIDVGIEICMGLAKQIRTPHGGNVTYNCRLVVSAHAVHM